MRRIHGLLIICAVFLGQSAIAFSGIKPKTRTINFSMTSDKSKQNFFHWYSNLINSTPFFVLCREGSLDFTIPAFNNANVCLFPQETSNNMDYVISVHGASEEDFGALCARFYESQSSYDMTDVDTAHLRKLVRNHFKTVKPHTGYAANVSRATQEIIDSIFGDSDQKFRVLDSLKSKGFVTLDTPLKTEADSNDRLSAFLKNKTKQSSSIRSDTVSFLDKNDATVCGLELQFDVLLGIASFLNENMEFDASENDPLFPGTRENPLTTPGTIQAAEYGIGEYYVAHSDNLLTEGGIRSNYRFYTCILYCNSDWDIERDGGALRIYPNTSNLTNPSSVIARKMQFEDISPTNGKLLIFDSRLIHSVEEVKSSSRKRRALTVWLMRPENNNVSLDVWNEEKGEIDWYKLS